MIVLPFLLKVSFTKQKLLSLMNSNLSVLLFHESWFACPVWNSLPKPRLPTFTPSFLWKQYTFFLLYIYFYNLIWVHFCEKHSVSIFWLFVYVFFFTRRYLAAPFANKRLPLYLCQAPISYIYASLPGFSILSHLCI